MQYQNLFLTCIVIFAGDGKGMQAMGGASSKYWSCKHPNGILEQKEVESNSRWGAFLRSITPDRRPGDNQHVACRIQYVIAKRTDPPPPPQTKVPVIPPREVTRLIYFWGGEKIVERHGCHKRHGSHTETCTQWGSPWTSPNCTTQKATREHVQPSIIVSHPLRACSGQWGGGGGGGVGGGGL